MAKASSSGRLGRDSQPKYLGVKVPDGGTVKSGMIIVKQRGTKFYPGKNVRRAGDDSIYALKEGLVRFVSKRKVGFNGSQRTIRTVNVESR